MPPLLSKTSFVLRPRVWFYAVVLAGILWRVIDLFLNFPIWGDEAAILLNVMDRSYAGLIQPLSHDQVAPLMYLWMEKWVFQHLGPLEATVRLTAFLPGLIAIPVFYLLARAYGGRYTPLLAVALLAVSLYPVRYTVMVKPYAFDLLISAALLLIGARILRNPARALPTLALALLAPAAFLFSYPAIFIVASVALAVFPSILRRGTLASRLLFALAVLGTLAGFLIVYNHVGQGQFSETRGTMESYWEQEFPPLNYRLPWWLLRSHLTGMMSYPLGGKYGSALLVLPLSILGAIRIWRTRSHAHAMLLVLPFLMTFLASIPHRYPYGGYARVEQHLAPCIFLLASHGLMALLGIVRQRLKPGAIRRAFVPRAVLGALAFYLLFALINIALDFRKTRIIDGPADVRQITRRIFPLDTPPSQQVVVNFTDHMEETFEFYFRAQPHLSAPRGMLITTGIVDESLLSTQSGGRLWLVAFHRNLASILPPQVQQLRSRGFKLTTVQYMNRQVAVGPSDLPWRYVETLLLTVDGPPDPPP